MPGRVPLGALIASAIALVSVVFALTGPAYATELSQEQVLAMPSVQNVLETQKTGERVKLSKFADGNLGLMTVEKTFYLSEDKPCRNFSLIYKLESNLSLSRMRSSACRSVAGVWELHERPQQVEKPKPRVVRTPAKQPFEWPYRPLYPDFPECTQLFWLPAHEYGVVTLEKRDSRAPLKAHFEIASSGRHALEITTVKTSRFEQYGIAAGKEGRWIAVTVDAADSRAYRYNLYYHTIDWFSVAKSVALSYGVQKLIEIVLRDPETENYEPVSDTRELIVGAIASFTTGALLSGSSYGGYEPLGIEIASKIVKHTGGGVVGDEVTSIVLSAVSAFVGEMKSYRDPSRIDQRFIRLGKLNCTDKCSVEVERYGNGRIAKEFGATGFYHAADYGAIFAPACDAVEPQFCRKVTEATSGKYFPSDWETSIGRLAGTAPDVYLELVESHNRRCTADPQAQREKTKINLDYIDNPAYETIFNTYREGQTIGDGPYMGALVASGTMYVFWAHSFGYFGTPYAHEYDGGVLALLRKSYEEIAAKRPRILTCYYVDDSPGVPHYSYWYLEAPVSPQDLASTYRYHPLLRVGPPQSKCPPTIADAEKAGDGYISYAEVRQGTKR